MADLEKEVARLRATERSLRDVVCNKLLLEEQVHQLTLRVEALQPVQQELHEAKVSNINVVMILFSFTGLEPGRAAPKSFFDLCDTTHS